MLTFNGRKYLYFYVYFNMTFFIMLSDGK